MSSGEVTVYPVKEIGRCFRNAENGNVIINIVMADGSELPLDFPISVVADFASKAGQMLTASDPSEVEPISGTIRTTLVSVQGVAPEKMSDRLVVRFADPSGMFHHMSFPTEQASQLRQQIRRAEEFQRAEANRKRQ